MGLNGEFVESVKLVKLVESVKSVKWLNCHPSPWLRRTRVKSVVKPAMLKEDILAVA